MEEKVSRKRAAIANTTFSGLQTVVAVINGMVLVPVYLQYVNAAEYGTWLATGNVLAWLTVVDPGVGDLARQRVAMLCAASRWQEACSVIWCGALVVVTLGFAIGATAQVAAGILVGFLKLDDPNLVASAINTLAIAGSGLGLNFVAAFFSGVIQSLHKTILIGWVALVGSLVLPVARLLLLARGMGIESFAWSMVAQGVFLVVASTAILAHRVSSIGHPFHFGLSQMRSLFGLTMFTSVQRVASVAGINLRGIFVTRYLGPEVNMSFEMMRAPLEFARTFIDKPMSALTPAFASLHGAGNPSAVAKYAARFARVFCAVVALCVAGFVSLNHEFVTLWVGPERFLGSDINLYLAIAFVLAVIINVSRGFLFAMGEIHLVSIVTMLWAIAAVSAEYGGLRIAGLRGLVLLPIAVHILFCVFAFPRRVVRRYLGHTESLALVWHALMPSCIAGAAAGASGAIWIATAFAATWLSFIGAVVLEIVVYFTVLVCVSGKYREEFRSLLSRPVVLK